MNNNEYPIVIWPVDLDKYNTRPISNVFKKASDELKSIVLNFRLHPMLAIPMSKDYFTGSGTSYYGAKRALETLKNDGLVEKELEYGVDIGRARVYRRTPKFDQTFGMRVGERLLVRENVLSEQSVTRTADNRTPISEVFGLGEYSKLIQGVKLSMSDGSQVFRDIVLYRAIGGRIYARGTYEYQNLPKTDRQKLLIGGEKTVELDYKSMHPNLLLNRKGLPCRDDIYERVLDMLGVDVTKARRDAVKILVNACFNIENPHQFDTLYRHRRDKAGVLVSEYLGNRPSLVRNAIKDAFPEIAEYVCAGDHSAWLQQKESDVMIEVLETLALQGVVVLPLHDSVILPLTKRDTVMEIMQQAYKRQNSFEIQVS